MRVRASVSRSGKESSVGTWRRLRVGGTMGKSSSMLTDTPVTEISRSLRLIEKPADCEYPAYAHIYIDLLPNDGLILKHLLENVKATQQFVASIPVDRLLHRYAEGKWTIKEI